MPSRLEFLDSAIVLAGIIALPGLGWSVLLLPRTRGLPWLAGVFGVGLLAATATSLVLATVGALHQGSLIVGLLGVGLAPLAIASTRRGGRLALQQLKRTRFRSIVVAISGLVIVVLSIVVPSHVAIEGWLPTGSTTWYYAHLSVAVSQSGGFPPVIQEWGSERAFQTDYAAFTAFVAAMFQVLPDNLLLRMETVRLMVLSLAGLAAVLMFRRWLSTSLAVLAAIALLGTLRMEQRFLALRPEAFAFALTLLAVWCFDRALVERSRMMVVLAAGALSCVLLAHAEVFLVSLPLVAGVAVARMVGPRVAPRGHARAILAKQVVRSSVLASVVVIGSLAAGGLVNYLLTGYPRLLGYAGATGSMDEVPPIAPDRIPAGWILTGDPTWDFAVAAAQPNAMGDAPPTEFTDPLLLPRAIGHIWPLLDANTVPGRVALAGLILLPMLSWPVLDWRRRRGLIVALVFGVGLLAGSWLLFARSETYVPARTGGRRLMPYELLVPVMSLLLLVWLVDRWVVRRWHLREGALAGHRSRAILRGTVGLILVLGLVNISPAANDPGDRASLSSAGWQAFVWIRENLRPGSRILVNAYTDGSVGLLSGGVGVIDGRAVYLEDPEFLGEATSLVLGARSFFQAPQSSDARRFIEKERVEYLLVTCPSCAQDVAGYRPFDTDVAAIRASDDYHLVRSFDSDRLLLFEVRAVTGRAPRPVDGADG
jgi:hypothetical protein